MRPFRPVCTVTRRDVYHVLFSAAQALREARLGKRADEFLERAKICSSYYEMVRLASEYVELSGTARPPQPVTDLADYEHTSMLLLDPSDWRILDASPTAAQQLNYSAEALTRMTMADLDIPPMARSGPCSPAARQRNSAILKDLRNTGHVTFESAHRHRDGTRVPVEVTL